jgi:glycosyltransferase involved in cell wall biosynthesis
MNDELLSKLAIVIPCYNEAAVLPAMAPVFIDKLKALVDASKISKESYLLFVDDGSSDETWSIIKKLAAADAHIHGISLSRNRGHQNALLAGLEYVMDNADAVISADCDGQDDLDAIDEMVDKYRKGAEVVYACRNSRETDTWFKRTSAELFYRMIRWMGGEVIFNHADFRLASRRVVQGLSRFREVNLFLRGMFPLVGYKSAKVYYSRKERVSGQSHYPFFKMLNFAVDGITSLSVRPIRMIAVCGAVVTFVSFMLFIWAICAHCMGNPVPDGTSNIVCVMFIGGVQLLSLGVIGEYIGKIYLETKNRPRYIVAEQV